MPAFPKCITLNNKLATCSAKITFGKKKKEKRNTIFSLRDLLCTAECL